MTVPPLPYALGAPAAPPLSRARPSGAAGRPPGTSNKISRTLKDAILYAAAAAGDMQAAWTLKEKGEEIEGGLSGYLTTIAFTDPKTFCGLLGRVLPLQVTGEDGAPLTVTFKTVYEPPSAAGAAGPKIIEGTAGTWAS